MYNYKENVHADILDFIEENIEKDVSELTEEEIRTWIVCMEENENVGGTMYGHYNVDDEKAAEYISENPVFLNTILHWAKEIGSTIESATDIDVLCRCYWIPTVLAEVIEERKAVKAQEEADRAKTEAKEAPIMNAYQRATWAKLFCEIELFNDWSSFELSGDDFDKELSLFLAGDEDCISAQEDFIKDMLEVFEDDSTDHVRLERLQRKLVAYRDFIA